MTYVLPFDFRLAFFKPDDKLFTGNGPTAEYQVNPRYSLLIAHIYAALYSGKKSLVIVTDPTLLTVCQQLLSDYRFGATHPEKAVGNITEIQSIDVANLEKVDFRGILLKPVYVESDSTIVYMIASIDDVVEHCPGAFLRDSLCYFNQIIRNTESGIGRVVWKDPVAQLSKLRDGYDVMFCLYVLDKCMQAINPSYPGEDVESNLATVIALHNYLLKAIEPKSAAPKEYTLTRKPLSTIPIAFDNKQRYSSSKDIPLGLRDSPVKRAFSDILYFTISSGVSVLTTATFIYCKSYSNMNVINAVKKIFPSATHVAFGTNKGRPGVVAIPSEFTLADAREYANTDTYLFYGAKGYDSFVEALNPLQALVPYDVNSRLFSRVIFGSIFAAANIQVFPVLSIVNSTLKTTKTKLSTIEFSRSLNYNWRNNKAWAYTNPMTGNDDTYDEAVLATYVEYFHKTFNLEGRAPDLYRLLLTQLKG